MANLTTIVIDWVGVSDVDNKEEILNQVSN